MEHKTVELIRNLGRIEIVIEEMENFFDEYMEECTFEEGSDEAIFQEKMNNYFLRLEDYV